MNNIFISLKYRVGEYCSNKKPHAHNTYQMIFVSRGSVTIMIDEQAHIMKAPSVLLLNCFEKHKIISSCENYARYIVEMSLDTPKLCNNVSLSSMLNLRPLGEKLIISLDDITASRLIELAKLIECEQSNQFALNDYLLDIYIKEILVALYRLANIHFSPKFELVNSIQTFIDENYAQIDNLSELAKHFNISYSYLSHLFKQGSGYSPMSYILYVRLSNCAKQLISSTLTIQSIARGTGFNDMNNFIRHFKKMHNTTPSAFRRKH